MVVGKLVRAYADPRQADSARGGEAGHELSWIEPDRGAPVRVPTEQVANLPLGATVKVTVGAEMRDAATAQSGTEAARQVLASSVVSPVRPAATLAADAPSFDHVTVVMVLPGGVTSTDDPTTADDVVNAVNGPVAGFWSGQSGGNLTLDATAYSSSWVTTTAGCDRPAALLDEVVARTSFVPGPYEYLLVYIPRAPAGPQAADPFPACAYGYGEVPANPNTDGGGRMYVRDTATSDIAHQLGHTFGLGHSSALRCDSSVIGGHDCGVATYGDGYDLMGLPGGPVGSLSAPQAARLRLMTTTTTDLQGSHGTYVLPLTPMSGSDGNRAIRLGASDGHVYWLEYRSATGRDAWLSNAAINTQHLQPGVQLRVEDSGEDTSLLLDPTPSPRSGWSTDTSTVLPVGRSVWLSGLDYYVTVKSVGTQAEVWVEAGDAPLNRDLDDNRVADLVAADSSGHLYLYRGNGSGGFGARALIGGGWTARDLITMAGDWDTGGEWQDLIARDPSGQLWLYQGNGRGGFYEPRVIGRGWQGMDALFSPGDWNGDGQVDLLARRRSDDALVLYPGRFGGGFGASSVIGHGWGTMTAFAATGDWDANGTTDFVVRRNDGALLLYSGDGRGGVAGSRVIGHGWNVFSSITGVGDWSGDGAPDLLARKPDGTMWLYPGVGDGGFRPSRKVGAGWSPYRLAG